MVLNKYIIGRIILTDSGIDSIRKNLRKLYPDVKATNEELYAIIYNEVLKREIVEGDFAEEARKTVAKQERKINSAKAKKEVAV